MTGYDPTYDNARRNYRDCPRSWHIPADSEYRRPTFLLVIAAVVMAVGLVGSVLL